jgi:hypothetical protein
VCLVPTQAEGTSPTGSAATGSPSRFYRADVRHRAARGDFNESYPGLRHQQAALGQRLEAVAVRAESAEVRRVARAALRLRNDVVDFQRLHRGRLPAAGLAGILTVSYVGACAVPVTPPTECRNPPTIPAAVFYWHRPRAPPTGGACRPIRPPPRRSRQEARAAGLGVRTSAGAARTLHPRTVTLRQASPRFVSRRIF